MEKGLFDKLYQKLNKNQREAVDSIEGPVMVVAGPGTGKTQILALRIANIVRKTDIGPESILALTFTESGVYSMRKRLVSMMGDVGHRVGIFTFHGFASRVIGQFPDHFPFVIGCKNISEIDKIKLIEKIIEDGQFEKIRPFGDKFYYVGPTISAISDLKRENITISKFADLIDKQKKDFDEIEDLYHQKGPHKGKMKGKYSELLKDIDKNVELHLVYSEYQNKLREMKLYDYDDMILSLVSVMENDPDLLLSLQEQYQYVLADEHQDANQSQNKILELLSNFHPNPNIFIVGDEKQAIFTFQGASLDNFLYFQKLYPEAKIIFLEDNYRSTQTILDSAHSLISGSSLSSGGDLRVRLKSNKTEDEKKINLMAFSTPDLEKLFILQDVQDKIKNGIDLDKIAIFFRDNKDALPFVETFSKAGVPFVLESDQNILLDDDIKKLIIIFRAVDSFGDDEALFSFLHIDFLEIDDIDLYKLALISAKAKKSFYDVINSDDLFLDKIPEISFSKIKECILKIKKWHKFSKNNNILSFFDAVVGDSGLMAHLLSLPNSMAKIELLNALYNNLRTLVSGHPDFSLKNFIEYIDILREKNISINKKKTTIASGGAVHLMTAHKSKGLEFDYVYITGAEDGHWSNRRKHSYFHLPVRGSDVFDKNEEERKLFYVALTRAKKSITITYAKQNEEGKNVLPSHFLLEIDPGFIDHIDTSSFEEKNKSRSLVGISGPSLPVEYKNTKDYLKNVFVERGITVTALNNYLKCPWRYFYLNLLRIPSVPGRSGFYGTAVHFALKNFFDHLKFEEVRKDFLLKEFEKGLSDLPLSKRDFADLLNKGRESLSGYYDFYEGKFYKNTINEMDIAGVSYDILGDIKLRGKIDKMEILDEDNVNVVDYKTGKAKSRNEIEGKTKNSDGDYKRQIVFYKILLDKFSSGRYKMVSGELDFVEPDEKGRFKKDKFEILSGDIKDLLSLISNVCGEILELKFWNSRCDDEKCKFCQLRSVMKI